MTEIRVAFVMLLAIAPALADIRLDDSESKVKQPRKLRFERYIFSAAAPPAAGDATNPSADEVAAKPSAQPAADTPTNAASELPFMLFEPKAKKGAKLPLIVYLHDGGKRAAANGEQVDGAALFRTDPPVQKEHPCFLFAPLSKEPWSGPGWQQADQRNLPAKPEPSLELVFQCIDELIATHPIDPDRIYLAGHGMGGAGALTAAAYRPDLFAAVAATTPQMHRNAAPKLLTLPIAIVAAEGDEGARHREIVDEIKQAGGAKVELFPSGEPESYDWLFQHKRAKQ
ncbi:MAG: PHB depolymerase family esterase [Phycisphaerae bacterium]|nr:PHB depolymerase family esterase [Phycisphaerae bacterium]